MPLEKFIKSIWYMLGDIFNEFINFIIENRLTSLLIVAILGIGITGLVTSLKTNIIEYYLNKFFKTSNNNLIMFFTAFIQFLIIVIVLFFIYKFILKRIAAAQFSNKATYVDDITWKKDMLLELKSINSNMSQCKK